MPVELVEQQPTNALPLHLVARDGLASAGLAPDVLAWADANGFSGEAGRTLLLPGKGGALAGALFGIGEGEGTLGIGAAARALPEGDWYFASVPSSPDLAALAVVLGGYVFTHYGRKPGKALRIASPAGADAAFVRRVADGVFPAPTRPSCAVSPTVSSWRATWSTRRPTTWGRTIWKRRHGRLPRRMAPKSRS